MVLCVELIALFEIVFMEFYIVWLQDKSFTFILKTPPASVLLLKAAGTPFVEPE